MIDSDELAALFTGKWRIAKTELWARKELDLVVPAHFTFEDDGTGDFQFIAVVGLMRCRYTEADDGASVVRFTFTGTDEGDPVRGRGLASIQDGKLVGRISFTHGDSSSFTAERVGDDNR